MTDYQLTLECINTLLKDHAESPFDVLRENGIQAELRHHLLEKFPDRVDAEVVQPWSPGRFAWPQPARTRRVQLEMKICFPADVKNKRADLVVLRNSAPVQLSCHKNGPGDIVAALRPEDVSVAVEIKASPSRDNDQLKEYASDLLRLLALNEECEINGFFVLLDKSHPRFGSVAATRWETRTVDMLDWATLRAFLGGIKITKEKPNHPTAIATMCYLCPAEIPSHVFVWK